MGGENKDYYWLRNIILMWYWNFLINIEGWEIYFDYGIVMNEFYSYNRFRLGLESYFFI